jgi:hypothetical protein
MKPLYVPAILLAATSAPALGEVKAASDTGFNSIHIATVNATPDEIWKRLITPKTYWNKAHSWSGSTEGFYIDPQTNGCFCELFQEADSTGKLTIVGSVEHMRVIFAQPGKLLRMQGSLGPLQSEAVIGTLTIAIEPSKDNMGTRVSFSYVVGGYMRYKVSEIAPAVDKVLGEQFRSMLSAFTRTQPEASNDASFKLTIGKIDETVANEASEASGAKADSDIVINELLPSEPR